MTNEALLFALDMFFSGVNFTAPTFYFGLGGFYTGEDPAISTAAKMTSGSPNPPVTNPFQDFGSRQAMDWSKGAFVVDPGLVQKTCPPVVNFSALLVFSSGYQDVTYMITAPGLGSAAPPAILWNFYLSQQPPLPAWAPGDFLEVTFTEEFSVQ